MADGVRRHGKIIHEESESRAQYVLFYVFAHQLEIEVHSAHLHGSNVALHGAKTCNAYWRHSRLPGSGWSLKKTVDELQNCQISRKSLFQFSRVLHEDGRRPV